VQRDAQLPEGALSTEHRALQERSTAVDADGLTSAAGANDCKDGSLKKKKMHLEIFACTRCILT